eukprot:SAG25_NODE_4385_length_827_cov_0.756868_2_plen_64_part_01
MKAWFQSGQMPGSTPVRPTDDNGHFVPVEEVEVFADEVNRNRPINEVIATRRRTLRGGNSALFT